MEQFLMATNIVALLVLTKALYESLGDRKHGWTMLFIVLSIMNAWSITAHIPQVIK